MNNTAEDPKQHRYSLELKSDHPCLSPTGGGPLAAFAVAYALTPKELLALSGSIVTESRADGSVWVWSDADLPHSEGV